MLKVIMSGRGEGKTARLIREAALTQGAILVKYKDHAKHVEEMAEALGLKVKAYTQEQCSRGALLGLEPRGDKKIYIDNIEMFLPALNGAKIEGFTVGAELGSIEHLAVDQPKLMDAYSANSALALRNAELENTQLFLNTRLEANVEENNKLAAENTTISNKLKKEQYRNLLLEKEKTDLNAEILKLKSTDTFWKWLKSKFNKK